MQYIENESVSVQAAREIRLYSMSELLEDLYQDSKNSSMKIEDKIFKAKFLVNIGGSIFSFIRNFAAYFYLIHLAASGQISTADFIVLTGLVSGLSAWMTGVMNDIGELRKMSMYMEDYFAYLDLPESTDRVKKTQIVHGSSVGNKPKFEFRQVSFRYDGAGEDTLKDINLVISPGEKLAVVGKNGAGKTTLIKLLSGLYKPCSGTVLVDGVNITNYSKEEYFQTISAVFQDIMLLPVSILENISAKTREKTDECKVRNCLEKAGISEKVAQLPQGLCSLLQRAARDDAVEMSGGEQQKVMIAKAIYKEAKVLILDEPTAALDPISENNIYQKYNELTQGMTSLFISHRLASTNFCDDIILIDDGKIIEQGNHQELMNLRGEYWKMFIMQSHYYAEGEKGGY